MGSRTINGELAEKNMDMGVLACKIGMGTFANIVYSYSLNSVQILELVKKEIASIKLLTNGSILFLECELHDSRLYINGMESQWNFDLIESAEDNFGAVIFSFTPVRGNETDAEWSNLIDLAARITVYFKIEFHVVNCMVEKIEIPRKNNPREDNGFSFKHFEVADAFRKSVHIQPPYKTTLTGKQVHKPSWYVTGDKSSAANSSYGGGCYVATAVYGSYDCPEVWTLRRFRDLCLSESWYGRAFIKIYYAVSPALVRVFGEAEWFRHFWKNKLDKMVSALNQHGFDDSPYND